MTMLLLAGGAVLLAALVLIPIIWANPIGLRRADSGVRYRVGAVEHVIPDLRLPTPSPRLVREPVLVQMAELLKYADRVLTEHGIDYWISCGTLLGAIRHNGFIPWDDDIDVQMGLPDRQRLLALSARFQQDGFLLLEAAGGYKLAFDNRWRFPYMDLVMVERVGDALKLCYPLTSDGQCTFGKAAQWPNECLPVGDVFPLARLPFESFTVRAPGRTVPAVQRMYGERSLSEARTSSPARRT